MDREKVVPAWYGKVPEDHNGCASLVNLVVNG